MRFIYQFKFYLKNNVKQLYMNIFLISITNNYTIETKTNIQIAHVMVLTVNLIIHTRERAENYHITLWQYLTFVPYLASQYQIFILKEFTIITSTHNFPNRVYFKIHYISLPIYLLCHTLYPLTSECQLHEALISAWQKISEDTQLSDAHRVNKIKSHHMQTLLQHIPNAFSLYISPTTSLLRYFIFLYDHNCVN